MKPTDFSIHLTAFLSDYLPIQKNVSRNTIKSYRDTFKLLILFCEKEESIPTEKLTMKKLSSELIERFLNWLETERKSSISTRNLRLTAIHSFFRYAQSESPESLYHYQKVLSIPFKRKQQAMVEHLSPEGIKVLLEQPDKSTAQGRRDLTLMSLMYDSGARAQEVCNLKIKNINFSDLRTTVIITGKGGKTRRISIPSECSKMIYKYIQHRNIADSPERHIFSSQTHEHMTISCLVLHPVSNNTLQC